MERPSRIGVISLLIAVEVVIAGFGFYTLRGTAGIVSAGGLHSVDYSAKPIAAIAAGVSPVVTIDDIDSNVVVGASNDGLVHVTDETSVHGFIFGAEHAQVLTATRTFDGVRIYRPEGHFMLGESTNRIRVEVPPMTRLTIARSGGDEISGLRNGADILSQDGRIVLNDITGNVKAHSNDGRIVGSGLHANQLDLTSDDGRIELSNIEMTGAAPKASFHTHDGPVLVSGIFPATGSYSLTTADGRIELTLLEGSDTTVEASTGDGRMIVNGARYEGQPIRAGAGNATMHVRSEDGSIHITTNGAQ